MTDAEKEIVRQALDALGLALAHHEHRWTEEERRLYERAIAITRRK